MIRWRGDLQPSGPQEVIVEVAGCGVCHTDLAFFCGAVRTRQPFPLTLGHEVSGVVVEAGEQAAEWLGKAVLVAPVTPCGRCNACQAGQPVACREQTFIGCSAHGGFATHVRVPARGLCEVPTQALTDSGLELAELAVVPDAVATPYHAVERSGLQRGDLAVFVGVGGLGAFGAQWAAERGAAVVAIDVNPDRLALVAELCPAATIEARAADREELKRAVRAEAKRRNVPPWRVRVFEMSGTPDGQRTAFELLGPGGYLALVGYSPEPVPVHLSRLMAWQASVQGIWSCPVQWLPKALAAVLAGRLKVRPLIELRPLDQINEVFEQLRRRELIRRVILVP